MQLNYILPSIAFVASYVSAQDLSYTIGFQQFFSQNAPSGQPAAIVKAVLNGESNPTDHNYFGIVPTQNAQTGTGTCCIQGSENEARLCGVAGSCCASCSVTASSSESTVVIDDKNETQNSTLVISFGSYLEGRWTTDGSDPAMCETDAFITKISCSGDRCDNIDIGCRKSEGLKYGSQTSETVKICNKNHNKIGQCSHNQVAVGVTCEDDDCAIMTLKCQDVKVNETQVQFSDNENDGCYWTGWFSEEDQNYQTCEQNNAFLRGLTCDGHLCDNISMWCCSAKTNNA